MPPPPHKSLTVTAGASGCNCNDELTPCSLASAIDCGRSGQLLRGQLRLSMAAGTYAAPSGALSILDGSLQVTELALIADGGATAPVRIDAGAAAPVFTIAHGAPHTSFAGITFSGPLLYNASSASILHAITACAFVAGAPPWPPSGGGVRIDAGELAITHSSFTTLAATQEGGALAVSGSATVVTARHTSFTANAAHRGGGVYVGDGARLTLHTCLLEQNNATEGGGLFVATSGTVVLSNTTRLVANTAGAGKSYMLSPSSQAEIIYSLPAPAAHWVANAFACRVYTLPCPTSDPECNPIPLPDHQQPCNLAKYPELDGLVVATLGRGTFDLPVPYECAAGLVGSASPDDQQGPACGGLCPSGAFCPATTTIPTTCPAGAFCPPGSPSGQL